MASVCISLKLSFWHVWPLQNFLDGWNLFIVNLFSDCVSRAALVQGF